MTKNPSWLSCGLESGTAPKICGPEIKNHKVKHFDLVAENFSLSHYFTNGRQSMAYTSHFVKYYYFP